MPVIDVRAVLYGGCSSKSHQRSSDRQVARTRMEECVALMQ